jgi:hypothetical protein
MRWLKCCGSGGLCVAVLRLDAGKAVSYDWYSAISTALTKFRYNILKIKNESSISVKGTMKCTMSVSLNGPSLYYCVRDLIRVRISRK